jgi:hypothetical protein
MRWRAEIQPGAEVVPGMDDAAVMLGAELIENRGGGSVAARERLAEE